MEVHHHAHTSRKKWTHYFWEFLMLFLAVFCGFLAENMREHAVEHKRAKAYARSLYYELRKDTTQLSNLILWTDTLVNRFDTLCRMTREDTIVTNGKLYYFAGYTGLIRYFSPQTTTIDQLRNSGNQRLINSEVALKLSAYEGRLKSLEKDYDMFRIEYETMMSIRMKIFDGVLLGTLFRGKDPHVRDSVYQLNPPLISNDKALIKEYLGWVKSESVFWRANIDGHLFGLRNAAIEILELLEKYYHLK